MRKVYPYSTEGKKEILHSENMESFNLLRLISFLKKLSLRQRFSGNYKYENNFRGFNYRRSPRDY